MNQIAEVLSVIASKLGTTVDDGDRNEICWLLICGLWFVEIVLCGAAFFSLETTVAAFFNPEYWALDHILSKIAAAKQ